MNVRQKPQHVNHIQINVQLLFSLCAIVHTLSRLRHTTFDSRYSIHMYMFMFMHWYIMLLYRKTRGYFSWYKHMHLKREWLWILCAEHTHLVNICDFFINKCKFICMNSNVNTKVYWWYKTQPN